MGKRPVVRWAQRAEEVLLTVETPDGASVRVELSEGGATLALRGATLWVGGVGLYAPVAPADAEEPPVASDEAGARAVSSDCVTPAAVMFRLRKLDAGAWWPRLTRAPSNEAPVLVRCDWARWVPSQAEIEEEGDEEDPGWPHGYGQ